MLVYNVQSKSLLNVILWTPTDADMLTVSLSVSPCGPQPSDLCLVGSMLTSPPRLSPQAIARSNLLTCAASSSSKHFCNCSLSRELVRCSVRVLQKSRMAAEISHRGLIQCKVVMRKLTSHCGKCHNISLDCLPPCHTSESLGAVSSNANFSCALLWSFNLSFLVRYELHARSRSPPERVGPDRLTDQTGRETVWQAGGLTDTQRHTHREFQTIQQCSLSSYLLFEFDVQQQYRKVH